MRDEGISRHLARPTMVQDLLPGRRLPGGRRILDLYAGAAAAGSSNVVPAIRAAAKTRDKRHPGRAGRTTSRVSDGTPIRWRRGSVSPVSAGAAVAG
jgi:hypothetical protein